MVNILSAGIWFENILNQALLRDLMHKNPTAASTHYALTELGDETRHMVMFGKTIERIGGKPVRPRRYQRMVINALPLVFRGSMLWVAALVGEEIFDALQRQIMDDPDLQPIVQRLMRIHVTEEARHIQFARDGLRKHRAYHAVVPQCAGQPARCRRPVLPDAVHPPECSTAGPDSTAPRCAGWRGPIHTFTQMRVIVVRLAQRVLDEVGLMGRLGRRMWRRAGFL